MSKDIFREINRRLARLEKTVFGQEGDTATNPKSKNSIKSAGFSGPKGGVLFLISKGLFKGKPGLADVRAALTEHGYHYSRQAVHGALTSLSSIGGPLVCLQVKGRNVYAERK
jgi:hypothetical protein